MRVDIKGNNPVTSEQFKNIIDQLNQEYSHLGLRVNNMTCYVRFVDDTGKTVEPTENGYELRKTYTIRTIEEVGSK